MKETDTQYVYQNGVINFPPPFEEKNSLMQSFLFESNLNKLQKVCDNWLNIPSDQSVYYQPLLPIVQVTFSDNKSSWSTSQPYCNWGYIPYREVIFTIFVVRVKKMGKCWVAEHVSALVPYIFVTDAIIMANGREIYGMPKSFANIDLSSDPKKPDKSYSLTALSSATFNKGIPFSQHLLASIIQTEDTNICEHEEWKDLGTAFKELNYLIFGEGHIELPGLEVIVEVANILFERKLPFTSLRQLRSLSSPSKTVYKAIVQFNAEALALNGGGKLDGTYQICLPENDLYPISTDLGLRDGQIAKAAYWIDWDFRFGTGKTIWTAKNKISVLQFLTQLFRKPIL